jgi:hypothetical protein
MGLVLRQLTDCRAETERRGWSVVEVYVDENISDCSGKQRPAYRRMLVTYGACRSCTGMGTEWIRATFQSPSSRRNTTVVGADTCCGTPSST